jgi:translation elongation factor EF-Tu-like GTPase
MEVAVAVIRAYLAFIPTEHGGRKSWVVSDYRPQFYFADEDFDSRVRLCSAERLSPGESGEIEITLLPLGTEATRGRLTTGCVFQLREGPKVVAGGVVISVAEETRGSPVSD